MQPNELLAGNLSALAAHCPAAAAWLAACRVAVPAADEPLADRRDGPAGPLPSPARGDTRPAGPGSRLGAALVLGVDCGHGLRRLLEATPPTCEILALEPDAGRLLACLSGADFREPVASGRLVVVPPERGALEAAIARLDVALVHGDIRLCVDAGPDCAAWADVARGLLDNVAEDLEVMRHFRDAMCANELDNDALAAAQGSVRALAGAARGAAALVLGAGPSLAATGPLLAEAAAEAVTVTALQTMPVVERLGIVPDFCLAFDFRKEMLRLYDGVRDASWLERTPLIYSTKCDPEVVRRYPGPKLPLWTTGGLAAGLAPDGEWVLDAGGNVGVAMVRLLIRCGASRIVLAGQDFAWAGQRSHAPGHHAHAQVRAFNPQRHTAFANLAGQTIHSNRAYLAAKRNLEKDVRVSGVPMFNLYGGGARIEGCPEIDFARCRDQGLLRSEPGARQAFAFALTAACLPRSGPRQKPRPDPGLAEAVATLERASTGLAALVENGADGGGPGDRTRELVGEALACLRRASPYAALLANQALDMAVLARSGAADGFRLEHAARGLEIALAALARALRLREFVGAA
jgi:hypothetical protein